MFSKIKNAASESGKKIHSVSCMKCGDNVKIVIRTLGRAYNARLVTGGRIFADSFNVEEPFDRNTHVFYVPQGLLREDTPLKFEAGKSKKSKKAYPYYFKFGTPVYPTDEKLINEYDNGLRVLYTESESPADGVEYIHTVYNDKRGAAVHTFTLKLSPGKAGIYVGTPDDGYESVNVRATIPDMINSAVKNGHNIVSAVNADFFDMFGDHHPSGLCVKNGKTVANPESPRPFIAALRNGGHVITDRAESPDILPDILHAAAGMQMIVKDGKIYDYAPLEPFGFTRHPRTAAGTAKDGTVILTVVDGRIPDHSNGASLVDLAKLMIENGADRAINLDGGGSSAVYTKKDGCFILRSRPADLVRPNAMLIRKDFNSLLVEIR